ncbi:hypothetical protein [Brevibacterium sp. CFH 10365]|uniref:hypothetical protein n=1 Tax=Brevibacterium sp. CFH 10365 TaxID=2585207 RepID=UPI0012667A9E|nr:hypothetical protein [Brevibacterium sp. CFH 10365]
MIAIVTVLGAFGLGYLLRSRLAAHLSYAVAYLWAFVFQTLYLLLASFDEADDPVFAPGSFPLEYGLVTLGILIIGFALIEVGHRLRARLRHRRSIRAEETTDGGLAAA